jgi:MFS family permease
LLALFAAGLLFWSSLTTLLPTLPLYIEDIGGTNQQVGLVMGSFAIGLLLFRAILGRLADRHSRKLVVIIGTSAVALAPFGYLLADSMGWMVAIRAFHGISIAAFTTGYSTLVVDLSPPQKRGELIGYMSLVIPIGLFLGPALGGYLQAGVGYPALFLCSGGLGLLGILCASQVSEPQREQTPIPGTAHPDSNDFWRLVVSPRLRIPAVVLLLVGLAFGSLTTFVALHIRATGANLNPGLFYSVAAVANFSMRLFSGRASDRYGRGIFISLSLVSYGLAMLLLSQAQSAAIFLVAGLLQGAGAGTLLPMTIALISDRSLSNERGRVYSVCLFGFDLGIAIAGPIFGSFAGWLGYRGIFSFTTGLTFLALLIFLTQSSKNLAQSLRFATGRARDIYALDTQGSDRS